METTKTILPKVDAAGNELIHMSCDGACTPDGRAGAAWFNGEEYRPVPLPQCSTNNQAEYMGLISLLTHLSEKKFTGRALIMMDSQLVVYQVTGKYGVKSTTLQPFWQKVQNLLSVVDAEIVWVSRENPIMKKVDVLAKGAARGDNN